MPKRFLGYFSMALLTLDETSRGKRRWLKSNGILRSPHTVRSDSCIAKAGLLVCRVPRRVRPVFYRWAKISDLARKGISLFLVPLGGLLQSDVCESRFRNLEWRGLGLLAL